MIRLYLTLLLCFMSNLAWGSGILPVHDASGGGGAGTTTSYGHVWDGANWQNAKGDSNGYTYVIGTGNVSVNSIGTGSINIINTVPVKNTIASNFIVGNYLWDNTGQGWTPWQSNGNTGYAYVQVVSPLPNVTVATGSINVINPVTVGTGSVNVINSLTVGTGSVNVINTVNTNLTKINGVTLLSALPILPAHPQIGVSVARLSSASAAATATVISGVGGQSIYITGIDLYNRSTTAGNFNLSWSDGTDAYLGAMAGIVGAGVVRDIYLVGSTGLGLTITTPGAYACTISYKQQ